MGVDHGGTKGQVSQNLEWTNANCPLRLEAGGGGNWSLATNMASLPPKTLATFVVVILSDDIH